MRGLGFTTILLVFAMFAILEISGHRGDHGNSGQSSYHNSNHENHHGDGDNHHTDGDDHHGNGELHYGDGEHPEGDHIHQHGNHTHHHDDHARHAEHHGEHHVEELHQHFDHHGSDHNHGDHNHTAGENRTSWTCPEGWIAYSNETNVTCLFLSEMLTNFYELDEACSLHGAKPVMILTEVKSDFIQGLALNTGSSYLLHLSKSMGYGNPFFWHTSDYIDAAGYYLPDAINSHSDDYRGRCVFLTGYQWDVNYCGDDMRYICEKPADCRPGLFGPKCSQECHCAGETCDTRSGQATCKFGCERGWTGPACSIHREPPEVRYFCVNSPEEHIGSYVDIHIHTKGVNYSSIYPTLRNSSIPGTWCNGTALTRPDSNQHMSIQIPVNDSVKTEIRHGHCAGQEVEKNRFEWTLNIQEYAGIVLDTDLQVVISCDFNVSETLQRGAMAGNHIHQTPSHKVGLSPDPVDVTLEVVDPYTKHRLTEAYIGTPAQLQIKYGYHQGSLVKGVCPHHCVATCPDMANISKALIDEHGCVSTNSPVSEFSLDANRTGSISTHWFPLFAFDGHADVQFKCSFEICVDATRHCEPGCRHGHHHEHHRRKRDTSFDELAEPNLEWTSGIIRVLPTRPPQAQRDEMLARRQQFLHGFNFPQEKHQPQGEQEQVGETAADTTTTTASHTIKPANKPSPPKTQHAIKPKVEVSMTSFFNPLTGLVFLALLVIFLTVFFTLHYTMTKGMSNLRQEIIASQSRERVIYVSPEEKFGKSPIYNI